MKLYTYFRSSASFRVRIAMNLKGLKWDPEVVWLLDEEQTRPGYVRLNPQALVPTLVDGDHRLIQSLAIIEYLDETHPQPPLLPADPAGRARVRALAQVIACEIHPLNNLRVLKYLKKDLAQPQSVVDQWYRHWCEEGLQALEGLLAGGRAGRYCHGDQVSVADICLVPQIFNARRFDVDLSRYPTVLAIHERLMQLDAFEQARPERQPEAARAAPPPRPAG
ncbi:MAG TPA: maleylacetoacetate isomerase [Burkholderiaceae bacterium]|nr:maleylacetoacetate isomerase [Burkholderiaceae bacterium]